MSNAARDNETDNRINERESSEALRGWTAVVLSVVFVTSTAALFTAGHAFRLGHLYEFGFDLAQLPENFHETLFWGFSGGMPLALAWLVATVLVLLGYGLVSWLTGSVWKLMSNRWRPLRRLALRSTKPRQTGGTHTKFVLSAFLLVPLIYLLWMTYAGAAEFQKAGTKNARELIDALRADPAAASAKYGIQRIELTFDAPAETVVRGYRLLCTEHLCSIYDPDPKVRAVRLIALDHLREIRVLATL